LKKKTQVDSGQVNRNLIKLGHAVANDKCYEKVSARMSHAKIKRKKKKAAFTGPRCCGWKVGYLTSSILTIQ
jgi:hypothetical protein